MCAESREPRRAWDPERWWEDLSLAKKILAGVGFGLAFLAFAALVVWGAQLLWNWLMPELFSLKRVSYWQALGLLALSRIIFGGFKMENDEAKVQRRRKRELKRILDEDTPLGGDDLNEY